MSAKDGQGGQSKSGIRQKTKYYSQKFLDALSRPLSPRLSPGHPGGSATPRSASHALPISRSTTPVPAADPQAAESDREITLGSTPSVSVLSPDTEAKASAERGRSNEVTANRLISALRALEGITGSFPPLKSALGDLIGYLDTAPTSSSNRRDYEQLADEFQSMANILSPFVKDLASEPLTGSIANIAQCIQRQVTEIKTQGERGTIRRLLSASDDQEDVIRRYRQIENLFRQLQCDMSIRTRDDVRKQLEITLLRGMSPIDDAMYNSSYSMTIKRHACTAKTREAIHQELQEWTTNPNSAKIYWMNGMAGTGKTTIAYSFCEWLEKTNRLGASFFCSRISSTCRSLKGIIPSLAYQLAWYSPAFRTALCRTLNSSPDAGALNVVQQFEKLIQTPMSEVKGAVPESVVIVIDALDECDDGYSVRLLLDVLLKLSQDLPLKFFVASRPEHAIRDRMMFQEGSSRTIVHLHDIEASIVEEDIKKYLIEALRPMNPPPSPEQIEQLAKRSRNLFIYAATVVRYIYPEDIHVDSSDRLKSMLATISAPDAIAENKYEDLNRLYSTVLKAVFDSRLGKTEKESMRRVLWTVVCAKEPMSAATIASLATLTESKVLTALQSLRSVVHVPENKSLISTLHASFPQFMLDKSRSKKFYCDESLWNQALVHRCLDVMKSDLKFNICRLESSYLNDDQVSDMETRVARYISPTLSYACRYWSAHLSTCSCIEETRSMVLDFLHNRLLFWMEVLSLGGCIGTGAPMLSQAQTWLRQMDKDQNETQKQVSDARNFVTWFAANPCSRSTPHIYISALPLCAKSSWVYEHYSARTQGLATITSERDEAVLAIWGTESHVTSVSISPNGDRIASGHADGTIHIYDAHTGAEVAGPIRAHTEYVYSVAFSPNGLQIASGSFDQTVCIWDSYSGALAFGPFRGHTDLVTSVGFSPDGSRVVSGSRDHTVIVWDTRSGTILLGPLKGHTNVVVSVTFSPDGQLIASGSADHTIRIWDAHTGTPAAEPLVGHQAGVYSVAFSPDGRHIASGSGDKTVRMWDVMTGANVLPPLESHTDDVISVAFSPNGKHIVSCGGIADKTIIIWDTLTGTRIAGPLRGHADGVGAVVFSPDGTRAVSGSWDRTIRTWAVYAQGSESKQKVRREVFVGQVALSPDYTRLISCSSAGALQVLDVHSGNIASQVSDQGATFGSIDSVAFSSQGSHVAAGASDFTIRVWDVRTNAVVSELPQMHKGAIRYVVFSPDGAHICSGSDDCTAIVWDICTSVAVGPPCEGHTASVVSLAYSPDGLQLVTGSDDKTVRVWDPFTSSLLHTLSGHGGGITSVAFSPIGSYVMCGCADGEIWRWDAPSGNEHATPMKAQAGLVRSPDSGSDSDSDSDSDLRSRSSPHTSPDPVVRISLSCDSTRFLAASGSIIHEFTTQSMALVSEMRSPQYETVHWVGFYPNSADILSVSTRKPESEQPTEGPESNIVRVWRPSSYDPSSEPSRSNYWSYEPDGRILSPTGMVIWVPPDLIPVIKVESESYYNPFILSSDGVLDLGYKEPCIGDTWSECYTHEGGGL